MSKQPPIANDVFSPPLEQPGALERARKQGRSRLLVLKLALLACFIAVGARLVQIQIVDAPRYQAIARKQYEQKIVLPAVRGSIYDRRSNVLASSTVFMSLAADPKMVGQHLNLVAQTFANVFRKPASFYAGKLREASDSPVPKRFVWLERGVRPELARRIEAADLDGVVVLNEPKRLYHYDELAGPLLGFTNIDNVGIAGLELELNSDLRGQNGSVMLQRDGLGRARPSTDFPRVEPMNGHDVMLTIDLAYQAVAEEELRKGVAANKADGGLVVMLNPKTGEILALAISPGLNPNEVGTPDFNMARNRVVTDVFEPGSLFKLVTASAAYERHLVSPTTRFNAENGVFKVWQRGRVVRVIHDSEPNTVLTFQEAIEHSSNIVMAKVGERLGSEAMYRMARDYGFGSLTGVDLPGEVPGRLKRPREWSGTTLQAMAYGYEVAVTPLQIAAAYAALANDGVLMRPYVVAQVRDADGDVIREQHPEAVRHVISAGTVALLDRGFEGVVERGTGVEARIDGLRIAGKTGTAKRVKDGRYAPGSYTASFAGFFPMEDPQVVCLVMIDNPNVPGFYGGLTAAPIFRAIAERIVYTSPQFARPVPVQAAASDDGTVAVPDVRHLEVSIGSKILEGHGLLCETFGRGDIILRQSPAPGKRADAGDVVKVLLSGEPTVTADGRVVVPDVRGMSVRRAFNRLIVDDFNVRFEGSGVVVSQSPSPGARVAMGSQVAIDCTPRDLSTTRLY